MLTRPRRYPGLLPVGAGYGSAGRRSRIEGGLETTMGEDVGCRFRRASCARRWRDPSRGRFLSPFSFSCGGYGGDRRKGGEVSMGRCWLMLLSAHDSPLRPPLMKRNGVSARRQVFRAAVRLRDTLDAPETSPTVASFSNATGVTGMRGTAGAYPNNHDVRGWPGPFARLSRGTLCCHSFDGSLTRDNGKPSSLAMRE